MVFWLTDRMDRNDGPKSIAFQSSVHLDLSNLTQDQYLYVCRNGLKFEVCRIVKAVLLDTLRYSHIDLSYATGRHICTLCYYSLGYSITANNVFLLASLLQVEGINPSIGENLPFGMACREGATEIVRLLLQDGRIDPSAHGNEAIIWASLNGHDEVVRLLLDDGTADPSDNYNSAIRLASLNGHVEVVRLFLADERVDPAAIGIYAIRQASQKGHSAVVKLLLRDQRVVAAGGIDDIIATYSLDD